MFGRATIALGIGPHSSCLTICKSFMTLYQRMTDKQTVGRNAYNSIWLCTAVLCGRPIKILPPGHQAGSVAMFSYTGGTVTDSDKRLTIGSFVRLQPYITRHITLL